MGGMSGTGSTGASSAYGSGSSTNAANSAAAAASNGAAANGSAMGSGAAVNTTAEGAQSSQASGAGSGGGASASGGTASEPAVAVSLMVPAKAPLQGLVVVSVPQELLQNQDRVLIPVPASVVEAIGARAVTVTGMKGGKLPKWLRYEPTTHSFVASSAAASALPYRALVRAGGESWVVLVTETLGS